MIFLSPAFLWLLGLLPAIAALHFLRTRRREQVVSALFLWQEAERQASHRRRFSLHWLLLLQLLAAAALALALARPVLPGKGEPDRILVIDASASMAAHDPDGVRLVKALAAARPYLEGRGRTGVIRAGLEPEVIAGPDASPAERAVALSNLNAADAEADLERAVSLARTVAPGAELHVFSDSPAAGIPDATWHQVAGTGHNLGITLFEVDGSQAFVSVSSGWPGPQLVTVRLERDGAPAGETQLLVPGGGQAGVSLPVFGATGLFRAVITPPAGDALQLDDEAWAGTRQLRWFMLDPSPPLERALTAIPGLTRAPSVAAADVLVARSDTALPATAPAGIILFAPPAAEPSFVQIRDWAAAHPLLRFAELQEIRVGVDPARAEAAGEAEGEVLARAADLTPLITSRSEGRTRILEFAFNPSQSDFIYRPAFPVLIANATDSFRGETALRLGSVLPEPGTFAGEPVLRALLPGVYSQPGGGVVTASLVSAGQTLLPGPEPAPAPWEPPAAAAESGDLDLSGWLLLFLLLLLAAEGLLYGRFSPARASA